MARSKEKRKARTGTEEVVYSEEIIDSYESWLKRQKPKGVKASGGFTGREEEEAKAT